MCADEIMVAILAETDAVFVPVRSYHPPLPCNVWWARHDFPAVGVPWASGASGATERKSAERSLSKLKAEGSVIVHKPKGRVIGVRLSDDAEAEARALVGVPSFRDSWAAVQKVAAVSSRKPKTMEQLWVPETKLAGVEWGAKTKPFVAVEEKLLPALIRGTVEARADMQGHVYYRMTPAGWKLLDSKYQPTEPPDFDYDDQARSDYMRIIKQALARFGTIEPPDTREVGLLPLPVSMHGCPITD